MPRKGPSNYLHKSRKASLQGDLKVELVFVPKPDAQERLQHAFELILQAAARAEGAADTEASIHQESAQAEEKTEAEPEENQEVLPDEH